MFIRKFGTALRDIVESLGPRGTKETIAEMLRKKEVKPEDFNLLELWAACERDEQGMVRSLSEAVSSDLFPTLTGELISSKIIEGYQSVAMIGDQVTTTVPTKMKTATIGGFTATDGPDEVLEGAPYNDSQIEEKFVQITHKKFGRIISVTEEAIHFEQTGQLLQHAFTIGEKAAQYREKLIVEGVQDVNSNVFKPAGVATAFYRSTASGDRKINLKASNPFGEEGIKEAMKLFHNMVDEQGDYVNIVPANLVGLFPFDLWVRVNQMIQSTLVPEGLSNAVNIWKGLFKPLTSPYITAQSTSTWYLGDFKRNFWWSEVWPLQTFSAKPGSEDEFRKDIKSQHKVRFFGQIGAVDDKHCVKNTA